MPREELPPKLTKIVFRPGINREQTSYSGEGGWYDCDKIRFRDGLPETIGGWAKVSSTQFYGIARSIHPWIATDGSDYIGFGTNEKLYIEYLGSLYDITPIRSSVTLGTDPFATTSGDATVVVTHTAHGAATGDWVTFSGGDVVAGLDLDNEYQLTKIDADSYSIEASSNASSTTTGGGAAVAAAYQISIGTEDTEFGSGFGTGTWGSGVWGGSSDSAVVTAVPRIWTHDNFGEDLLSCVRNGALYYWDKSGGTSARAVALSTLSGASNTPTVATKVLVSSADRHAVAFGTNTIGTSTQDKLLIRWSDSEDVANWTPDVDNEAGSLRLQTGSEIVTAVKTKNEIFVLTNRSAHSFRWVGGEFIFGESMLADNVTIIGPNAAVATEDAVVWMGYSGFYVYSGRIQPLQCTVEDYVFQDINRTQRSKVFAGYNGQHNEILWFYPSSSSNECDRYVAFNIKEKVWYYGTLARTAWTPATTRIYPVAMSADRYEYFHEYGQTADGSAITHYIESSLFDLDDGDRIMFVKRALPDLTFNGSTATTPSLTITFKTKKNPGSAIQATEAKTVTRSASGTYETYTNVLHIRKRGRHMIVRYSSSDTGVRWRAGAIRLDMRPDGQR